MPIVCIDPGHGGVDPGAVGLVIEKDIALRIAQAAKRRLLLCPDVVALQTRDNDVTVPLGDRARVANRAGADVFLSIHANAGGGTGFESFCHPAAGDAAHQLQEKIHKRIPALGVRDRGPKEKNLQVLRETRMPAVLVECLFVDNAADAKLLKDIQFLRLMGRVLADGVASYLGVKIVDKDRDYKVHPDFAATVEMARQKGLSTPGSGHDYTQPLSEERFWALVARILRWK